MLPPSLSLSFIPLPLQTKLVSYCAILKKMSNLQFVFFYIQASCLSVAGEAIMPIENGILDNYRVKRQLLHSW